MLRCAPVQRKPSRTGITPVILLEHMRGMEGRLIQRIDGAENKLTKRIDGAESSLTTRMDRLENKVDRMHVNLSGQIDAIDKRLDAVEIEFLPKRVAKLERVAGIR